MVLLVRGEMMVLSCARRFDGELFERILSLMRRNCAMERVQLLGGCRVCAKSYMMCAVSRMFTGYLRAFIYVHLMWLDGVRVWLGRAVRRWWWGRKGIDWPSWGHPKCERRLYHVCKVFSVTWLAFINVTQEAELFSDIRYYTLLYVTIRLTTILS